MMYKINFNGNYNGTSGCHGKLVTRANLQSTLDSLLDAGMQVHHISKIVEQRMQGSE
jgi:hypothetical protein